MRFVRPSADLLFELGGIVIVQDPKEAKIPIMPKMAVTQDHVDLILPLAGIAAVLPRLAKGEAIEKPS